MKRKLLIYPCIVSAAVSLFVTLALSPTVVTAQGVNPVDAQQNERLDDHESELVAHERELNAVKQPPQSFQAEIETTPETTEVIGICSRFDHNAPVEKGVVDDGECSHFQSTGTRTTPGSVVSKPVYAGLFERKSGAEYYVSWLISGDAVFELVQAPPKAGDIDTRPACLLLTGTGSQRLLVGDAPCSAGKLMLRGKSGTGRIAFSLVRYR